MVRNAADPCKIAGPVSVRRGEAREEPESTATAQRACGKSFTELTMQELMHAVLGSVVAE